MIWRAFRVLHRCPRSRIPTSPFPSPLLLQSRAQSASALRTTKPNVAAVLDSKPSDDGHAITVTGSVRTIRNQKHHSFLELGDGSTTRTLQALLEPAQADGLGTGTTIEITGVWRPSPAGKAQQNELKAETIRIIGRTDAERYPIQKKHHSAEYLRTLPHLRLRTPLNALLARMRSECDFAFAQFFRDRQFIRLQPPLITSSDCEGAGEVFTVSSNQSILPTGERPEPSQGENSLFFRNPKFLTVSSQLHLEAFVNEHQNVWTFSPTFRAERSDTPRHVSEFWMLEAEMQTESLHEVMELVENLIRSLTLHLQGLECIEELNRARRGSAHADTTEPASGSGTLEQRWQGLLQSSWPRITYEDAIHRLQDATNTKKVEFQYHPSWDTGLQLEHEKYLVETVGHGSPLFVTDYPSKIKPFYMLPSTTEMSRGDIEHETVSCFDLLLPEMCEVVGGSLREHRTENLTQAMRVKGLNVAPGNSFSHMGTSSKHSPSLQKGSLDWYVDLRRYGSVPHGGFGLGFDRLLGYLAGISNIKDVVPWPRYYGRCDC